MAFASLGASAVTFGLLLALGYGLVRWWWYGARFQRAEVRRLLVRAAANSADALRAQHEGDGRLLSSAEHPGTATRS